MKNNIGFFTHETDAYGNGKFLLLRAYYGGENNIKGWALEARFWALNCFIGLAENAKLDLKPKREQVKVAKALDLSLADLEEFLRVLSEKEFEIELIHRESGVVWTEQTQEDLGRAMKTRNESYQRKYGKNRGFNEPTNNSTKPSDSSAEQNHGAEQSRAERRGEEQQASTGVREGEDARPPAFDFFKLQDELKSHGIVFSKVDLARIGARIESLDLDDGFVAYVTARARDAKPKSLPGLVKKALLEYEWHLEYKAKSTVEKGPPPLPDPGPCPECGG